MDKEINLDVNSIIEKEFSIDFKGYSAVEVDQFLDMVAGDYSTYGNLVSTLKEKIAELEEENEKLSGRIIDLETKLREANEKQANEPVSPVVANLSQVDILRRIARLEQEVFNNRK